MQILDANEGQSQPDPAVGCVGQIEDQSEIQPEAGHNIIVVEFIHERQTETVPGEWSEVVEVVNEGQPEAPAGDVVFTIECDNGQAADPGVTGEKQTEEITIEGGQEHERHQHHENVAVAVGIEDENHDNENNVSE